METITFQRCQWSSEAAAGLSLTLGNDEAIISAEVIKGVSQLWRVNDGSWLITRAEDDELVIVCFQGKNSVSVGAKIIRQAKAAGFKSIRAHVQRRGMVRMFERFGARQREIVLGLDL